MTTLATSPAITAIEEFQQARGPMETWSAADFEGHQNLAAIALEARPVGGIVRTIRRRTTVLTVVGVAFALYATAELLRMLRGTAWMWLEQHVDELVHGPVTEADRELRRTGDLRFRRRIEHAGMRLTGALDRLNAGLARL
ncbi:hypothetical protein [Streptomyces sp. Isolate_45]|uniref:hypothetical protein n=1 Tax=Streptomyces sp. Isolate_45 TaxID=2950111 RepID=UPI002481E379|nr:hypothetical protein [Streptomyces sp. Isolate_45]MDA5279860.1 hypothetical protein [Streptomyces sp. Isolate_45]